MRSITIDEEKERRKNYVPCQHGKDIQARVENVEKDLSEILDILKMGKEFFRFAAYFGEFAKWCAAIAAPIIAAWAYFHGTKP